MNLARVALSLGAALAAASASASVAGTYRCWSYNVSGGAGSCRLAPPLVLRADGTYAMSSERGTWRVRGDRVELSESKLRGPGRFAGGNHLVFEYDYRGLHHTVTYLCRECAAAPPASANAIAPAAGNEIRVDLRLRFPRNDGVLDWFSTGGLVPAAAAEDYRQGGRLPSSGAEGLAYRAGEREVAVAFKHARAGQEYVVFLSSGRERLAVARIDLTGATGSLEAILDATLAPEPGFSPPPAATPAPSPPAAAPPGAPQANAAAPAAPCNPLVPRYQQKGCRERRL